jgi:hypothetical protein
MRAMFDRMVAEGHLPEEYAIRRDSAPAAFGDVIHYRFQTGVNATFPKNKKPSEKEIEEVAEHGWTRQVICDLLAAGDPLAYSPSPKTEKLAADMFGGDVERMRTMANNICLRGFPHLPKLAEGDSWLAEVYVKTPNWTGHADLVSKSGSYLVDIKSSSKAQLYATKEYGNCLREAFAQTCLYNSKLKCENVGILYLDTKQPFARYSPVIQTPELLAYADTLNFYCGVMRSSAFQKMAIPQLLDHRCGSQWCPFVGICRDKIRPHEGPVQGSDTLPTGQGFTL